MEGYEPIVDPKQAYAAKRFRPVSRLSVERKIGHLSNVEMQEMLEVFGRQPGRKPGQKVFQPWIHSKTLEYLKTTPVKGQSSSQARGFIEELKQLREGEIFKELTKADKLQLINIQPQEESTLYAIIEEFETRFPEEVAEEIQALVCKHFPKQTPEGDNTASASAAE